MAKHAEGREKSERLVIPVTVEEHAFAKSAAGEAGFAGKAREVLRAAGLLPPLTVVERLPRRRGGSSMALNDRPLHWYDFAPNASKTACDLDVGNRRNLTTCHDVYWAMAPERGQKRCPKCLTKKAAKP